MSDQSLKLAGGKGSDMNLVMSKVIVSYKRLGKDGEIEESNNEIPISSIFTTSQNFNNIEESESKLEEKIFFILSSSLSSTFFLRGLSLKLYEKEVNYDLIRERLYYVLKYVKKVENIDIDEKGEPAFYVSYDDWINYVKNSDLQAIVFPTKRDFEYLDALERIGIKVKSVTENEEVITIIIDDCEKLMKAEYVVFVYGVFNALLEKREILPTCKGYSDEEMIRHLDISLEFSQKYLGKWYE